MLKTEFDGPIVRASDFDAVGLSIWHKRRLPSFFFFLKTAAVAFPHDTRLELDLSFKPSLSVFFDCFSGKQLCFFPMAWSFFAFRLAILLIFRPNVSAPSESK